MNFLISGHRKHKLLSYDTDWIKDTVHSVLYTYKNTLSFVKGFSGMASGVDLWFCEACFELEIPYVACIPFEEQEETMDEVDAFYRRIHIQNACEVRKVKNSWMVEKCDCGIIVWDGNKGGTHNVFQQMIELKKPIHWINPHWKTLNTLTCANLKL